MTNNIAISQNSIQLSNQNYFRQNKSVQISQSRENKSLSKKQKIGILASSIIGASAAISILAKTKGYSLNPNKILKTPLEEMFLAKEEYGVSKVLTIGAGSCLGGFLGGMLFDKDKQNRQAKKREALIQYVNISLPIATVAGASQLNDLVKKVLPKNLVNTKNKNLKALGYAGQVLSTLAALCVGIYSGNKISNKINQKIFKSKDERPVQFTDWSAHVDDLCIASRYIAPNSLITKGISRIVPLALVVPGYEIGTKKESEINKK